MAIRLALGFCLFVILASASKAEGALCNPNCTLTALPFETFTRNEIDAFCSNLDRMKTCRQQLEAATNCTPPSDSSMTLDALNDYVCSSEGRQGYVDHGSCLGNHTGWMQGLKRCDFGGNSVCGAIYDLLDCWKDVFSETCGEKGGRFWVTFFGQAHNLYLSSHSCMPYGKSSPTPTQASAGNNSPSRTPAMSLTLVTVPAAVITWLISIWM